ncbi:nuclear transport factor 2 family protein [Novosphingobium olei]|uniref:nuclear transport factor 2 family protein n=1 Tax=Novosphingobium olei TaxID=2728851 RepID=UPI00308CC2D5|nr:nuclear transport factor 2 family protein [Novosphingobium olei]
MNQDRANAVRDLVTRVYALAQAGDFDAIRPLFSPDFAFVEADDLAIGGTYAGFDGYLAIWSEIARRWTAVSSRLIDLTVSDRGAVGIMELDVVSAADGQSYHLEIAEQFEVAEDLTIKRIKPFYFNTKLANQSLAI